MLGVENPPDFLLVLSDPPREIRYAEGGQTIGKVLARLASVRRRRSAPTPLWIEDTIWVEAALRRSTDVRALAHVTGGGIEGNLSRVLPEGLRAEIDYDAWDRPPVFHWLARHVAEEELRRVFNLGIGFCAVVPDAGDELVIGRIE